MAGTMRAAANGDDAQSLRAEVDRLAAAEDELAAAAEFDITLVNTSVQDVCRQLIPLL